MLRKLLERMQIPTAAPTAATAPVLHDLQFDAWQTAPIENAEIEAQIAVGINALEQVTPASQMDAAPVADVVQPVTDVQPTIFSAPQATSTNPVMSPGTAPAKSELAGLTGTPAARIPAPAAQTGLATPNSSLTKN